LAPSEKAQLVSWFSPFTSAQRQRLLDGRPRHVIHTALDGSDRLERMLAFDLQSWLPDNLLERGDRMAMSASVELRPPLLDHRLVELAFSLPSRFKIRRGKGKWVLRQVARSHLPSSIIDRHKVGFRVPLDAWFRSDLREMARDMLLGPGSFVGDVMDRGEIRRLLERHEQGPSDESIRIWTLLSLEHWHQVFFRAPSSAWALGPRAALETPTV
jgi:asparagine synthase (glutamine-hydrolysing)